jgi:ABC-type sugar transport system ATPase subunit
MGENGSGKSTLVKILSGVHTPDGGIIEIDGVAVRPFTSPSEALRAGVATVFQEVLTVESQTVAENLWLGSDGLFTKRRSDRAKQARGAELLERLVEHPPPLDALVGDLDLSDRQACAIARAILRDPRLLILDEATSALDFDTRNRLFDILRERRAEGASAILISHRIDEVREIADRVTVLRSGRTAGTLRGGNWEVSELVGLMTSNDRGPATRRSRRRPSPEQAPVLETIGLPLAARARPVDFQLHAGELVGLAGLEGQGQDRFLRALWGLGAVRGAVIRRAGSGQRAIDSKHAARRAGIAYVPRERRAESIFGWMSILDNFLTATIGRDRRWGFLSGRAALKRFEAYAARLAIKMAKPTDGIGTLSGGNQQKVIIARWLAARPDILLLNDPTRGIDIGAKRDLYALLDDLTSEGLAVVMLSTEVEEHLELMDRVLVFRDNELAAQFERSELTRDALVESFFGVAAS